MSKVPDAWEDEWSTAADELPTAPAEAKKVSSKVTKAQRRAQQAEFNRQLWAEAEGPRETNYFLESRNVVPLRSEFKPPPILLSRKGPIVQSQSPRPPTAGLQNLGLNSDKNNSADRESSEDEEEVKAREISVAERQAQAARDREEKQRKYEERRQELFGTSSTTLSSHPQGGHSKSGTSSPGSLTPPGSRSATPNRNRGRRGGRRGAAGGGTTGNHNINSRNQARGGSQHRELYDPLYGSKPDSTYTQRRERENGLSAVHNSSGVPQHQIQEPIRAPRGPDGSGRGGFGFVTRATTTLPVRHAEAAATTISSTPIDREDATPPISIIDTTRTTS